MKAPHSRTCLCSACTGRRSLAFILVMVAAIACAFFLSGCTATVTPAIVPAQAASFDGGEQTSGILQLVDGGALITAGARARYNALVRVYGEDFLPALEIDQGLTAPPEADPAGAYFITNEALQNFILMNTWRRMGRIPSNK